MIVDKQEKRKRVVVAEKDRNPHRARPRKEEKKERSERKKEEMNDSESSEVERVSEERERL